MTALVLEPHCDDCVLFACFTALREQADVITVLRSKVQDRYGIYADRREHENRRALGSLSLRVEQWPFDDLTPAWDGVEKAMAALTVDYDRVYAPAYEEGGHEQHNRVAELADKVLGERVAGRYLTYTRHGGKSVDGVPVQPAHPSHVTLKLRALACFRSQIETPEAGCSEHFLRDQHEYLAA